MDEAHEKSRPLSGWLLLGILCLPLVFAWLLFRRGYSRSMRFAAFSYAAVMTVVPMLARLGTAFY